MTVITRDKAISQGKRKYFTGGKCRRGHISERFVANQHCTQCAKEHYKANKEHIQQNHRVWRTRNRERERELSASARERARIREAGRPKPIRCEICNEIGVIEFDHCHVKNIFRGWLCARCNRVLGHVKDSPQLLIKLANYLIVNE